MMYSNRDADLESQLFPDVTKPLVAEAPMEYRHAFIRKVYSILLIQLMFSIGLILMTVFHDPTKAYFIANIQVLFISSIAVTVAVLIPLVCIESLRKSYPTNYILLAIFTLAESVVIAMISMIYSMQYGGEIVLQALAITFAIVLALTLWTLQSKRDFSHWGGSIFAALLVLIMIGFIEIFIPFSRTLDLVVSCAGALLFSLFLVYDTWQISQRLRTDEYIIGAIELYLDIINLFVYILRILGGSRQ